MYAVRPRPRPPMAYGRRIPPAGADWKFKWPSLISSIIGLTLVVFSIVIFALEIASLAQSTSKSEFNGNTYGSTASTGAGIWCGFFIFVAGILMILIQFMRNKRQWATTALLATIIAACFSIILIGLDAKAVKDGNDLSDINEILTGSSYFAPKFRILAAQLAFAVLIFLLCIAYIVLYFIVLLIPSNRRSPQAGIRPVRRF